MPQTSVHKTRQHSNLRPKHKHTKQYLKHYWPYLPLILVIGMGIVLSHPTRHHTGATLGYTTNLNAESLLAATNGQRTANKQPVLTINPALAKAAGAKALDMATRNYWSHNTPEGALPWTFIAKAGYQYQKAGENLAYGFDSGKDVITGWMNSPTHRQNLLDPAYKEVGFGYAQSKDFNHDGPATVVVAFYGQPTQPVATPAPVAPTASTPDNPLSTNGYKATEPTQKSISKVQSLTGGRAPWSAYAIGILIGAAIMYLVLKHGWALKRRLLKGEQFIVHHPLLDILLILVIILGVLISQQAGVIK